jgi:predicted dehydrogenase
VSAPAIRVALVGCGEHARESHAAPLASYAAQHPGRLALAAVCDLDRARAERFRRDFGFERAVASVEELADAGGFDACVCVVPIDRIAEVTTTFLERGTPCVVEKPLGPSVEAAERLADVARRTATPHMVSVNRRFLPYLNRAKEWAAGCGRLRFVRATLARHGRAERDFVWSTAVHAVDALRHVAGEVSAFDAEILRHDTPAWFAIALRFDGGVAGRVDVLPTAGVVEETYELFGDGFSARVVCGSGSQRSLRLMREGDLVEEAHASADEPEHRRNGSYEEVVEFVDALRAGRSPRPTIDDVLPSVRLCFAVSALVDPPGAV